MNIKDYRKIAKKLLDEEYGPSGSYFTHEITMTALSLIMIDSFLKGKWIKDSTKK